MENYLKPLSLFEVRQALRLHVWKETDKEMLIKQLRFFLKELGGKGLDT